MINDDDAPTPFDAAQICERIEQMLQVLEWSWSDLETRAGVTEKTFRRWRDGEVVPRQGRVRRAAMALGVEYEEITHGLRLLRAPRPRAVSPRRPAAAAEAAELDVRLIERAMGGERQAMRQLVDGLTRAIAASVSRALRRRRSGRVLESDVADLTQSVLLLLFADGWRVLLQWDPGRGLNLPSFAATVARNVTAATLRSMRRSPWSEEPVAPEVVDESAANGAGPESQASSREMLAMTTGRVCAGLNARGVEMFQLVFVDGRPTDEVCAATGATRDVVYAWRNRLGRRMREIAAELAGEAPPPANDTARPQLPASAAPRLSRPTPSAQAATNCRSTSRR